MRCTYTSQSVCTLVTFYNKRIRKHLYLREVLNECSIAFVFWEIPKHRVCIRVRIRVGPRVKGRVNESRIVFKLRSHVSLVRVCRVEFSNSLIIH